MSFKPDKQLAIDMAGLRGMVPEEKEIETVHGKFHYICPIKKTRMAVGSDHFQVTNGADKDYMEIIRFTCLACQQTHEIET